jgi:lipoyl(octanoyl) transferase
MIYPVVSLRERGLGVKNFVQAGLEALCAVVGSFGICARVSLNPAGVWVYDLGASKSDLRKIVSVGLRVRRGVTDHGFALNVNCDLQPYKRFAACGLSGVKSTSIVEEMPRKVVNFEKLIRETAIEIERCISKNLEKPCVSVEFRGDCHASGKMV